MRLLSKFLAGASATARLVTLTAGPAFADPPSGTVPRDTDAVGVGADTTAYLFDQFSLNYNKAHAGASTLLYSWDASNPKTGAIGDSIQTKAGCTNIPRPSGGNSGVSAMDANAQPSGDSTNYCIDYARTSTPRNSSDPPFSSGGVAFVALAGDAVTWASRSSAHGGTDAPATLTQAQLASIYECDTTNWDQVGGKDAPIKAFLPLTSAATRTFWLLALGGGTTPITPGPCVSDLATKSEPGGTLQQNEGVNPALNSPEAIFIYSVGDYVAQAYHSAKCLNSGCTPNSSGQICKPTSKQNAFGCNETGVLQVDQISGIAPIAKKAINTSFPLLFQRSLFDVVRYDPNTSDHIPGSESGAPGGINLEQFFGASGYACSSAAKTVIKNYGFLPTWPLSTCGATN